MKNKKKHSFLVKLSSAIKYCFNSSKKKYTLETYLKIVSEYADRLIISMKKSNFEYIGGECKASRCKDKPNYISFNIELYFRKDHDNVIKKEASRNLEISRFTKETVNYIEFNKFRFSIEEPKEVS